MTKTRARGDDQLVSFSLFGVEFSGPLGLGLILFIVIAVCGLWYFWPRIVPAPVPVSVELEVTSSTLVKQDEQQVCSQVGEWSRNCHNRKDGDAGCPDVQEFSVKARTELGRLRGPRIVCVTDNDGSCAWNRGSHFKRATWEWIKEPSHLKFETPISSKPVRIKVCATEEVRKRVPSEPVVVRRWEDLADGSTFSARVPADSVGVLSIQWSDGQQRLPVGESYRSLALVSINEILNAYTEYGYAVQKRSGR